MHLAVVHHGHRPHPDTGEAIPSRWLLTEAGDTKGNIPAYVRAAEPTVFVVSDPSAFLAELEGAFQYDPDWYYSLTRTHTEFGDYGTTRVKLRAFGFRSEGKWNGRGRRRQRLHQCWDPRGMSPAPAHTLFDTSAAITHETLMGWALDIREWAQSQDLELRNAFAGYASQLLRDERFYPEARRRVPRATNERARGYLPGNLTSIHTDATTITYNVSNIDQRSAHHRIVQEVALPDANTLFARGHFTNPDTAPTVWAYRGSPLYERTIRQHGLLCVGMHSRRTLKHEFRLKVQDYQGYQRVYIWSNALPFLESNGSRIEAIYAAWTSTSADSGLPRYGQWAQNQIEHSAAARAQWLKPLLHSTYGLLAARPRPVEVGHKRAKGGRLSRFLLGAREFEILATILPNWQPPIANVIQRGMIDTETQLRSLTMAQHLTAHGCKVLHIHTDGIHVTGQLPLLPSTWTVKPLTRVSYLDRQSWVADEKQCLPGRDAQRRQEIVEHYARLHAATRETRQPGRFRRGLQRAQKRT